VPPSVVREPRSSRAGDEPGELVARTQGTDGHGLCTWSSVHTREHRDPKEREESVPGVPSRQYSESERQEGHGLRRLRRAHLTWPNAMSGARSEEAS
jgi:hypothetical protein